jgi:hypothetical protein
LKLNNDIEIINSQENQTDRHEKWDDQEESIFDFNDTFSSVSSVGSKSIKHHFNDYRTELQALGVEKLYDDMAFQNEWGFELNRHQELWINFKTIYDEWCRLNIPLQSNFKYYAKSTDDSDLKEASLK